MRLNKERCMFYKYLQIKDMFYMPIDLKKNHALMVPIKSTYVFESTNRFIYEYIRIDL